METGSLEGFELSRGFMNDMIEGRKVIFMRDGVEFGKEYILSLIHIYAHADKVEKGHKEPQIYQDRQHRGFYRSQESPAFMLNQLGKSNQRRKQADVQRQLRRNDVRLQDPDKSDCKIIPLVRIPEEYFIQAKRGQGQKHHGQHFSDRASYINTQQAI